MSVSGRAADDGGDLRVERSYALACATYLLGRNEFVAARLLARSLSSGNWVFRLKRRASGPDAVVKLQRIPRRVMARACYVAKSLPDLAPRVLAAAGRRCLMRLAANAGDVKAQELFRAACPDIRGALILEYVPARVLSHYPSEHGTRACIASALALMHTVRVRSRQLWFWGADLDSTMAAMASLYTESEGLLNPARALRLRDAMICARAKALRHRFGFGDRHLSLCHGDLVWSNLGCTGDGRLVVFDFDNAGIGDPALDLALFAAGAGLASEQELEFLELYLDVHQRRRSDPNFLDRYFGYRSIATVITALTAFLGGVAYGRASKQSRSKLVAHLDCAIGIVTGAPRAYSGAQS